MGVLFWTARAVVTVGFSVVMVTGAVATATAEPADNQAGNDKLFALLSGGYTAADCRASNQYAEDPFIARLGCGPNSQPGGPSTAIYSLYGNDADLNWAFDTYQGSGDPVACPGAAAPGPTAWPGGMVACSTARGPSEGAPRVSWTRTGDLVAVSASGNDLDALYSWWLTAR